jgi:hypothetical protein
MLPSIALVHSVEMIRDGGSLATIFQGSNGSEYWLFFKVRLQKRSSGETERLGFLNPVIVDRLTGNGIEISWQHAKVFLNQMHPFIREDRHSKWFEIMQEVVEMQGRLPPGIKRILG